MGNKTEQTPKNFGFGFLPTDAFTIRQFMKDLGWTETRLANEAGLSQSMINAFLNEKRKLSPAASDRTMDALRRGSLEKKEAEEALKAIDREFEYRLTKKVLTETPDDGTRNLRALLAIGKLAGPPRDPEAYRAWKAKQLELHSAADELHAQRERNAELEKDLAASRELISQQEEVISAQKDVIASREKVISLLQEMKSINRGWVEHLKQQLRNAGITPDDYFPND